MSRDRQRAAGRRRPLELWVCFLEFMAPSRRSAALAFSARPVNRRTRVGPRQPPSRSIPVGLVWWLALRLHLTVMVPDGSVRARRLTAAAALLLGGCFAWVPRREPGGFGATAEFAAELKPVPPPLVPAQDPARVRAGLQEVKSTLLADPDSLSP